jgi:hypothetical protein
MKVTAAAADLVRRPRRGLVVLIYHRVGRRTPIEVDLVAESTDGAALLIGEVEWTQHPDPGRLHAEGRRKAKNLPFAHGRELVRVVLGADVTRELVDALKTAGPLRGGGAQRGPVDGGLGADVLLPPGGCEPREAAEEPLRNAEAKAQGSTHLEVRCDGSG